MMCRAMAIETFFYMFTLLLLFHYGSTNAKLFKEEDFDLDKQFELLKKPSIKTIKTKYGGIYDCVDFYKQPGFDHPLLKDHTNFHPQMKPSFTPKWMSTHSKEKKALNHMRLKDGGCPNGTVPIRRITKDEFIATKRFTEDYASRTKSNDTPEPKPGEHYAIVRTISPSTMKYNGASSYLSIHNFRVTPQYSSGRIKLENGDESIQFGWMVNPEVNHDNLTHSFLYFNAGKSHCFNTQCPGFIITSKEYAIDGELEPSKRGAYASTLWISIYRDSLNGNWWLAAGPNENKKEVLGFWPAQIFTTMINSATYVSVGGEAYGPPDGRLPPMGNGYFPNYHSIVKSAFSSRFGILDENDNYIENPKHLGVYTDSSHYGVQIVKYYSRHWKQVMFYGGTTRQWNY